MRIRKGLTGVCCGALLVVGAVSGLHAAAAPASDKAMSPAATATGVRGMIQHQITAAQTKLIQLAEATPADKFSWRPGPGVRSTGEVFMHVASANYTLPTFWGAKAPSASPRDLEKDGGDKAKTVAALKDSFDYAQNAISAVPESDLHRAIKVFGHDATVADAMMGLATHAHEHLGQSIAYARVNGIVPPWSAGEGGH